MHQDYAEAMRWWRDSQGDEFGTVEFARGYCCFYGKGVQQDYPEAARWLLDALCVDLGQDLWTEAAYMLCRIYAHDEAVERFRPAVWDGDWKSYTHDVQQDREDGAQFYLGLAYTYGRGVARDYTEAAKWFRKSADAGDVEAQFHVAVAHDKGRGVPQDFVQAYLWFTLAASGAAGDLQKYASDARENVARKMTPRQIDEAQRLAREWKPTGAKGRGNLT